MEPSPSRREDIAKLLVRLALAFVFFSSGVIKLVYENQGALRFAKLGLAPSMATFVSMVEITAALAMLAGVAVRFAGAALVADMLVAIVVSKLPLMFGPGPEPIGAAPKIGFWAFAYQARLDLTMLTLAVAIALLGAGRWSVEEVVRRKRSAAA